MSIIDQLTSAKCCFSATVHKMVQNEWSGESATDNYWNSVCAYNALLAIENSLSVAQSAAANFDLTDYVFTTDQLEIDINTSDSIQLVYIPPTSYAGKDVLIQTITDAINEGDYYVATLNGYVINLTTTRSSQIGITAVLTINNVFSILNEQISGGFKFTINPAPPGFLPSFTCYNTLSQNWWISNSVYSADTTMAICDKNGLISLESYVGQAGQRGISFNETNERVYLGSSSISVIDANPASGTYKTALATLATGGLIMSLMSSQYNNYLYAMYAIASGQPVRLRIYQPDNTVSATLLLSNYTSYSNWFNTIALTQDYCYALGYETDEVFQIDANPTSGTFNAVINTISFIKPCSLKIFNGRFFIVHGAYNTVDATLSEVDSSFNILQSITVVQNNDSKGVDFHLKDQYLYVQGVGNTLLIYNASDLSLKTTITQVPVGIFFESPDGSLWVTMVLGSTLAIFDGDTHTFRYDLDFDDASIYTTTCLDLNQINSLFCTMGKICGDCDGVTVGSFGGNINIIGDGNGNAVDANGNYVQV